MSLKSKSKSDLKVFASIFFMFTMLNLANIILLEDKGNILFYLMMALMMATSFLFVFVTLHFIEVVIQAERGEDVTADT